MDAPPPLAPTQRSLENTRCTIKAPHSPLSFLPMPAHPPHISIPEATVPLFPEPATPSHHLSLTNSYSSLKTQSNFMYQLLTLLVHPCLSKNNFQEGGVAEVHGLPTTAVKGSEETHHDPRCLRWLPGKGGQRRGLFGVLAEEGGGVAVDSGSCH